METFKLTDEKGYGYTDNKTKITEVTKYFQTFFNDETVERQNQPAYIGEPRALTKPISATDVEMATKENLEEVDAFCQWTQK